MVSGTSLATFTDSLGAFSLAGDSTLSVVSRLQTKRSFVKLSGNTLLIDNPNREMVQIETFTLSGKCIDRMEATPLTQTVLLDRLSRPNAALQIVFLRVSVGKETAQFKVVRINRQSARCTIESVAGMTGFAKTSTAYTLEASAAGYKTGSFIQTSASASGLILTLSLQTSDTLNTFQPFFIGSGEVEDIGSGQKIVVLPEKMIHVIVLPEGYTAADIAAGRYDADLRSFYQSIMTFKPMPFFRQTLMVWKYPVASNSNIAVGGASDTYFKVPVSSSGVSSTLDTARSKVWELLAKFPYAPKRFYPGSGNTAYVAKNVVIQFLILDPTRGRAGYSGLTTRFTNPAANTQRVSAALAQDQSHEFMHAFGLLSDEYYDSANGSLSSSTVTQSSAYITNVVYTDSCGRLPWQHLIKGGAYNPGVDSLVGAFGLRGRFHPELKCLMNGTHDNAALYGGNGFLRVYDRLCNFCGEIATFRAYERLGVLDAPATSYSTWVSSYRQVYYTKFPFIKPLVVPQKNSSGQAWFVSCR
jgi:hypothetical protein